MPRRTHDRPRPHLPVRFPIEEPPTPGLSDLELCWYGYEHHPDLNPVLETQPDDGSQFADERGGSDFEADEPMRLDDAVYAAFLDGYQEGGGVAWTGHAELLAEEAEADELNRFSEEAGDEQSDDPCMQPTQSTHCASPGSSPSAPSQDANSPFRQQPGEEVHDPIVGTGALLRDGSDDEFHVEDGGAGPSPAHGPPTSAQSSSPPPQGPALSDTEPDESDDGGDRQSPSSPATTVCERVEVGLSPSPQPAQPSHRCRLSSSSLQHSAAAPRRGSASEREGASQSIPCGHLIGACSPQSGQRQWLYNGTTWQEHSLTRLCRWYQLASLRDHGFWQDRSQVLHSQLMQRCSYAELQAANR